VTVRPSRRRALIGPAVAGLFLLGSAPGVLAAPPTNDDRAGATPIAIYDTGSFDAGAFDLAEATVALDDPALCAGGVAAQGSVWFAYTAVESGPVVITFGGDDGTAVHVLAPDGTTEIGCAVTADPDHLEPHVDLDGTAGETYLIELAGRTDVNTIGFLVIERPLAVSLDPVTTGHVTASGAVVVSYVFSCAENMVLEPELDLTQGSGANLAMGSTLETHNCHAPGTTITMTVVAGNGPNPTARFRDGSAEAFIQFNALTFAQFYRSPSETKIIELSGAPSIAPPATDTATASGPAAAYNRLLLVALIAGIGLSAAGSYRLRRPRFPRA
jgi:hypothetical protein